MKRIRLILAWVAVFAVCAPARGTPETPPDGAVYVSLLADVKSIAPGQTFTVGVLLEVPDAGWHLYWKNPGDSGRPTTVQWSLPEGFVVEELPYPLPMEFSQGGGAVMYGYERQVMLTARITAPPKLEPGIPVVLKAKATWLACKDVCIPGSRDLSLQLPVAQRSEPAKTPLFAEWARQMPTTAAVAGATVTANTLTRPSESTAGRAEIELAWDGKIESVKLFPEEVKNLRVEGIEVKHDGRHTKIALSARVLKGQALSTRVLPMLVVCEYTNHERRGFVLDVSLDALRSADAAATEPSDEIHQEK
ncbi:MAG TPA: protein-disulfide reductase DsbD domain-containing protein [Tepidisphaeraceae bacterium]|jgi:DsbC/DsbD-like thiol-disulfide interchange protein